MRIVDPGHLYALAEYDTAWPELNAQVIRFMKRSGKDYPGNNDQSWAGTNCQEMTRVLIDRVKYLQQQIHSDYNTAILAHYRMALLLFEQRAAERHGVVLPVYPIHSIESVSSCLVCGHIVCADNCAGLTI